jgi:hypothetical protein
MLSRRPLLLGLLLGPFAARQAAAAACCGPITPDGQRLAAALDASNVEHLWTAGWHVNWRTGETDRAEPHGPDAHTHCSAFAAAMAERFGIYILRPPEHPQQLLANAQMKWLGGEGAARGWRQVRGPFDAQEEANRGIFVVASYENPDPHRAGHIAILRPSVKSREELERDGPQVTQAGEHNHLSIAMRHGFGSHPGAWERGGRGAAVFFAHTIERWPEA